MTQRLPIFDSFHCGYCHQLVARSSYGTRQRNHCPYCLWSLHVDEEIGDRQATCRGLMKPLGLTTKADGEELMIVHQCTLCKKLSKNRIAGDDDETQLLKLFQESLGLSESVKDCLRKQGLGLVTDEQAVAWLEQN